MQVKKSIPNIVIAFLLLPIVVAVSKTFYQEIASIREITELGYPFLWGVGSYLFLQAFLFKLTPLYTIGHELVHGLACLLCGGRITSFQISGKGGAVGLTKTNMFVELAPYFLPFYTLLLLLSYFLNERFLHLGDWNRPFFFLFGFSLCFHLAHTVESLKMRQSDLARAGFFLSLILIYLANIIIVGLLLASIFDALSTRRFLLTIGSLSGETYLEVWRWLVSFTSTHLSPSGE